MDRVLCVWWRLETITDKQNGFRGSLKVWYEKLVSNALSTREEIGTSIRGSVSSSDFRPLSSAEAFCKSLIKRATGWQGDSGGRRLKKTEVTRSENCNEVGAV